MINRGSITCLLFCLAGTGVAVGEGAPGALTIRTVVADTPVQAATPVIQPAVLSEPTPESDAAAPGGVELPLVSQAVLRMAGTGRDTGGGRAWKVSAKDAAAGSLELGPRSVRVSPGTTTVLEVAQGHLNRIVTPFASPAVRTVSAAQTQVDGNVVYVASGEEEPVTLYISDSGNPDIAVGLTLAPRRIPPREIRLALQGVQGLTHVASVQDAGPAEAGWAGGTGQPYVEGVVAAFRDIARNQVPPGYGLHKAGDREGIRCAQGALKLSRGQVLDGTQLRIYTAVARNAGTSELVLDERGCSAPGAVVAAVAAWPRVRLAPGEETELYVAMRPRDAERERRDRPSLLGRER